MGSGWYHEWYYPEYIRNHSVRELSEQISAEFHAGVADSGIMPGIIGEIGSGEQSGTISPSEEPVLRAVARVRNSVGVPISTHAFQSKVGFEQQLLLREEGVPPSAIVIGHADSIPESDYHLALITEGVWVSFDLLRARADWDMGLLSVWLSP